MIVTRKVYVWLAALIGALVMVIFVMLPNKQATGPHVLTLPEPCQSVTFEEANFIFCVVDPVKYRIELQLKDSTGQTWQDLKTFVAAMHPVFSMNAGMYHQDLSPVGLYIENGQKFTPLLTGAGDGNFFMKPNGVFGLWPDGTPFVTATDTYARSTLPVAFATQSGPMLVIDGEIHPQFEPDGSSRYIRNGVGVDDQRRAVFVISQQIVSFGKFARLFRDLLQCKNALYFDGVISAFSDDDSIVQGGNFPVGPIVAVFER